MLYDVKQIAEITELSEATIYRKMNLKEMREYIVKKSGKRYLDEQGLEVIKKILNDKDSESENNDNDNNIDSNVKMKDIDTHSTIETTYMQELLSAKDDVINSIKEQLNMTKEQLEIKDKQIEELNNRTAELHKLIENSQVLLKEEQQRNSNQLLLEQHLENLDTKINDVRERMEQRKEQTEKKGFFRRKSKN